VTRKIVRQAGDLTGKPVLEVGPGPGGLTRALIEAGACVTAVEKDPRCHAALAELAAAAQGKLRLIAGDALDLDYTALFAEPPSVVANLPYNVGTQLLLLWLQRPERFSQFILMFQKEVGDRLGAAPGSRDYGRLSVLAQWLCTVESLFDLPPRAFTPPPKVSSTVVRLVPRDRPLAPAPRAMLERLTAAAFGQRRKMLRASLRQLGPDPEAWLRRAGIEPTARAETLSVEDFCRLANEIARA
jgi:16S rRNA (adenine1518-N6/adenine1519-N6)-dimethyltransferase